MDITRIIDAFGYVIYVALAGLSDWGVSNVILLYRSPAKKKPMHSPDKPASTVGRPSKRSWRNRNSMVKFARK
jgi:hypothetical protein